MADYEFPCGAKVAPGAAQRFSGEDEWGRRCPPSLGPGDSQPKTGEGRAGPGGHTKSTQLAGVWPEPRRCLGGEQALWAFRATFPDSLCKTFGRQWPGQTLELVTELKVNVARCCLYVCFLPQCLYVSLEALSWKPGVVLSIALEVSHTEAGLGPVANELSVVGKATDFLGSSVSVSAKRLHLANGLFESVFSTSLLPDGGLHVGGPASREPGGAAVRGPPRRPGLQCRQGRGWTCVPGSRGPNTARAHN